MRFGQCQPAHEVATWGNTLSYLKISKLFKTFGKAVPGVELENNNNNNDNSINQKVL